MNLIDASMIELTVGRPTSPLMSNSNTVCCVVEGEGRSSIGETVVNWGPKDIFTLPQHNRVVHEAASPMARMLMVSDRDALQRLGILSETPL